MAETSKDDIGGFSLLTRAYKDDPTIENYVALRRQHPNATIQVAITGALEWVWGNEEILKQFGIDPYMVSGALDADPSDISELSLQLLELIIERKKLEKAGKTHVVSRGVAISDTLVNYLINMMLDALDWNDDLFIPRDLIVLIRHQTGGAATDWDRVEELKELRTKAIITAVELVAEGKLPTIRAVARKLGVSATTVMRWYPEGELARKLQEIAAVIKKERKAPLRAKSRAQQPRLEIASPRERRSR
jgi:hypothetical protein